MNAKSTGCGARLSPPRSSAALGCGTLLVVLVALGAVRAGTAETPLTPAQVRQRMEAARTELAGVRSNIVLTLEELTLLRQTNNPRAQFQQFGVQLTNMEQQVNIVAARARAMKERADAYFAAAPTRMANIQDPQMRQWAKTRLAVRKQSYDRLVKHLQEAKIQFTPLLAELKQIQGLLQANWDAARLAAAKDLFTRANWHCVDVQRSLMQAEAELTFLASDFGLDEKPSS